YPHHRKLCDRGTAVVQLSYRGGVSSSALKFFRKTILLSNQSMKHERETPTAVGERLTRKELGRESEDLDSDRRHSYRVYNPVRIAISKQTIAFIGGAHWQRR